MQEAHLSFTDFLMLSTSLWAEVMLEIALFLSQIKTVIEIRKI